MGLENEVEHKMKDKKYIASEDEVLMEFIISVLEGKAGRKGYQTISLHISERLAKAIEDIVGFCVADFGNEIDSGQTEHIWKEHGKNGRSDHSMSDIKNLARIGYVVNNFDNIREGKNKSKYKNGDGTLAKTIEIQKRLEKIFIML